MSDEQGGTGAVLIVEDAAAFRYALQRLAESRGLPVETAATVSEALAKLGGCGRVLLDLELPDGSGCAVLERLRAERLAARVAVVTGSTDGPLLARARALGAERVFVKPPEPGALLRWLEGE